MTSPLELGFDVECSVEHAFTIWTARIGQWWPRDHSVSGARDSDVTLEGRVGGRIYERTADGTEHDWGVVTCWEPPRRLGYLWHLGGLPSEATEVEIRFNELDRSSTRVEIEHRGWGRPGAADGGQRERNQNGWESLLPYFIATARQGGR